MEIDKEKKLRPCQVREGIVFIPFYKFFNCLICMEEDTVWWLFNMKKLVYKRTRRLRIWTEKEYAVFTDIISKPDAQRIIYLKLANLKEDNEGKEENFST